MVNRKLLIRITLWWAIIADLFETIRMIVPKIFLATTGINVQVTDDFRFALLYGAPVMLGWTIILFWADRKPIKRSGIFICLIPVIIGYFIVEIIGIQIGILGLNKTFPSFILQSILLGLSITSFYFARKVRNK